MAKEHPILFSEKMVRAILDEKKTQTRRVVKQDVNGKIPFTEELPCPYGLTGDRLWVRESWQAMNTNGDWWHEVPREERSLWNWAFTNPVEPAYEITPPRWMPSIHMMRGICRIMLEITQLRIERVHEITNEDAVAEGFYEQPGKAWGRLGFSNLWNEINAKRGYSWESNPFVWVIYFKRIYL